MTDAAVGEPGLELEPESVFREREAKELEALVDPGLRADTGCSVHGLYELVGEFPHSVFSFPSLQLWISFNFSLALGRTC